MHEQRPPLPPPSAGEAPAVGPTPVVEAVPATGAASAPAGAPIVDDQGVPTQGTRRLHPFSLVRGLGVNQVIAVVSGVAVLAGNLGLPLPVALLLVVLLVGAIQLLGYVRHTYEIADGFVVERSGVLSRRERTIEIARLQQIDVARSLLDRAIGTAELRLETAADAGTSELTLRVVSVDDAERLRSLLRTADAAGSARPASRSTGVRLTPGSPLPPPDPARRGAVTPATVGEGDTLIAVPLAHVIIAALTGRRLLAVPLAVAAAQAAPIDVGVDAMIEDAVSERAAQLTAITVVALVVLGVLVSAVAAVVYAVLRDGGFTIRARSDDSLSIARGLTTTRTSSVPRARIQRITIHRSFVRGKLGFGSLTLHTAGGVGDSVNGEQRERSLTVPLMPLDDIDPLVDRLLGVSERPALEAHPPAARLRSIVRSVRPWLLVTFGLVPLVLFADWPAWLFAPAAALLGLSVWAGNRAHDHRASGMSANLVGGRTGLLGDTIVVARRTKIQGTTTRSSWFQRRRDLVTLSLHIAGPTGGFELVDVSADRADEVRTALVP